MSDHFTKMTKPIKPEEVTTKKADSIPGKVYEAFNELIIKGWDSNSSIVYQSEVVDLIAAKMGTTPNTVYQNKWLEIEDIYADAGWKVDYEKPGYCETGRAYFEFSK